MWEVGLDLRQHECLFVCILTSIPFVNVSNEYYYDSVYVCSVASLIKVKIKFDILQADFCHYLEDKYHFNFLSFFINIFYQFLSFSPKFLLDCLQFPILGPKNGLWTYINFGSVSLPLFVKYDILHHFGSAC